MQAGTLSAAAGNGGGRVISALSPSGGDRAEDKCAPDTATTLLAKGSSASNASANAGYRGCTHVQSKLKTLTERLKHLVPYSIVCRRRQALLLGRRGAASTVSVTAGPDKGKDTAPGGSTGAPSDGDRSRKRLVEEMPSPLCVECGTSMDNVHICLSCDYCGCWRRPALSRHGRKVPSHIASHLNKSGHEFAMDFYHFEIYCNQCGDYIYDPALINFIRGLQIRWYAALCDAAEPEAKRPRIVPTGADFNASVQRYLKEHGTVNPCGGLRGLRNLGATCYLSVVVQVLVHNPMFRNWMLNDGHFSKWCKVARSQAAIKQGSNGASWFAGDKSNSSLGGGSDAATNRDAKSSQYFEEEEIISDSVALSGRIVRSVSYGCAANSGSDVKKNVCFTCELISIFNQFHSESRLPVAPTGLLRALWLTRPDLSGYGQQDAHECFITVLDQIHTEINENTIVPPSQQQQQQQQQQHHHHQRQQQQQVPGNSVNSGYGTDSSGNTPIINIASPIPSSFSPRHGGCDGGCSCIIHQTFGGILQSTVTCLKCKNTTQALDPILDVSLDIPEQRGITSADCLINLWKQRCRDSGEGGGSRSGGHDGDHRSSTIDNMLLSDLSSSSILSLGKKPGAERGQSRVVTLQDCLERFTNPESLPKGVYVCSKCNSSQHGASKRLCIKQLAPVMAFQLKRFEHGLAGLAGGSGGGLGSTNGGGGGVNKINTYVRLPLELDMTPYTAAALASHAQTEAALKTGHASGPNGTIVTGNGDLIIPDGPGGTTSMGKRRTDATHSNPACQYGLFAVIGHKGRSMDTGHYVAYARHRGEWFKFDDAMVTKVDISEALQLGEAEKVNEGGMASAKGMAYMAFYIKQILDYNDVVQADVATNAGDSAMGGLVAGGSPGVAGSLAGRSGISGVGGGGMSGTLPVTRMRLGPNGDMKIERRGRKKGSTNSTKSKLSSAKAGGELHGDDKRRRRTLSGGKQALTSDYSLSPSPSSLAGGTVSKATLSTTAGMPLSNMSTPTFASNGPAGGKNLPGILEEGEVDESPGGDGMAGLMHMGSMSGGSLGLSQTMLASGSAGRPSGLAIHNNSCDLDGDDDDDDDDEEPLLAFLDKSAAGNGSDELQPMASLRTVVNGDDNGNNNDASFFGDDNSNGAISQDTGLDLDDAQMPK